MAKIDLVALRAAAEKVTPGPWKVVAGYSVGRLHGPEQQSYINADKSEDAAHIANCDPQTILALIEAVEAARFLVDRSVAAWEITKDGRINRSLPSETMAPHASVVAEAIAALAPFKEHTE